MLCELRLKEKWNFRSGGGTALGNVIKKMRALVTRELDPALRGASSPPRSLQWGFCLPFPFPGAAARGCCGVENVRTVYVTEPLSRFLRFGGWLEGAFIFLLPKTSLVGKFPLLLLKLPPTNPERHGRLFHQSLPAL